MRTYILIPLIFLSSCLEKKQPQVNESNSENISIEIKDKKRQVVNCDTVEIWELDPKTGNIIEEIQINCDTITF